MMLFRIVKYCLDCIFRIAMEGISKIIFFLLTSNLTSSYFIALTKPCLQPFNFVTNLNIKIYLLKLKIKYN